MKTSKEIAEKTLKAMTDDIQKRTWFKYYRNVEDFVLEAMRKSIEDWEKCALTYDFEQRTSGKNSTSQRVFSLHQDNGLHGEELNSTCH